MPVNGADMDPRLAAMMGAGAGVEDVDWFDAHTHMGFNDPDGLSATPGEIIEALDAAGQRRALIFAMHEPDGYAAANDAVFDACRESEGRLLALARIDPKLDAVGEAERCLARGARGFKLHPRSDGFPMPHAGVEEIVAIAHEQRMPVLFHAGRGIPNLGDAVVDYARRYPDARLILAHAGISDLGALEQDAVQLQNLYFDTSWWLVSDVLQLFSTISPARILYGSDAPYGPPLLVGWAVRRLASVVGLDDDALASVAGAQLDRVLSGDDPIQLGGAPADAVLGPRSARCERVIAHLAIAANAIFRGGEPLEALQLAHAGCQSVREDEEAELLSGVAELIELAIAAVSGAGTRGTAVMAVLAGQIVAGTPSAGPARLHA